MNRRLIFTLTFVLTLGIAASAWAGSFSDNDYQGRIESDHGTFFGFDLNKEHGVTKLSHVESLVKLQCTNGEDGGFPARFHGSLRVKDNDSFKGTLSGQFDPLRGAPNGSLRASVSGKLQKGGKAKGKIDETFDFTDTTNRGSQHVHCYSGAVDWAAKRGAIVNPQDQGPNRLR